MEYRDKGHQGRDKRPNEHDFQKATDGLSGPNSPEYSPCTHTVGRGYFSADVT